MKRQAGFGTRVLNYLVDTLIIFLLAMAIARGWKWYVFYYRFTPFNFGWFFWGITVLYYLFFEYFFRKTPAKWLTYSHVVTNKAGKPSFLAILIRSVSRLILIDSFFIPFLDKTLHDYLSKTEVVQD